MIRDYIIGVDIAEGDDRSIVTVWKRPSRFRKWLRRRGWDRSTWEQKLVKIVEIK